MVQVPTPHNTRVTQPIGAGTPIPHNTAWEPSPWTHGGHPVTPATAHQPATHTGTSAVQNSAKAIVQHTLDQYGLGSLINWAWTTYTAAGGGTSGTDAITAELPNTKEFQARFPAYQQLAKEGRAMTVQQMLNYEQTTKQLFHAAGLPDGFYDTPQGIAKFMIGDVSTSELQARVQDAQKALVDSPQDVRDQLLRLEGVTQGGLVAHFLDPQTAEPILAQQFTAAQIAAQASRTGFGQIDKGQAEGLAKLGVTDSAAQTGFTQLGNQAGLFQQQVAGETAISQSTQLAAQFGGSAPAQQAFLTRRQQRVSQFQEDSGIKAGAKGASGLGSSDQSVPA